MKLYATVPTIIALLVIFSAPFSYMPLCGKTQGGLVCYCCAGSPEKCKVTMACPGCKAKDGEYKSLFTPEMILPASDPLFHFRSVYFAVMPPHLPGSVYIEVPGRPPVIV